VGVGVGADVAVITSGDIAIVDVPVELVAVANALYLGACPAISSIVAVTESDPPEEATTSLNSVGTLPFLVTVINTL
jgi:hypothetical protein